MIETHLASDQEDYLGTFELMAGSQLEFRCTLPAFEAQSFPSDRLFLERYEPAQSRIIELSLVPIIAHALLATALFAGLFLIAGICVRLLA